MRCRAASSLMSLQLDGGLPPQELARLSRHLERCARCRATWAAMRRAHDVLGRPQWLDPPAGLSARVLARLPADRRSLALPVPIWTRASQAVLAGMVLLFVGLAALTALLGLQPGQEDWLLLRQGGKEIAAAGWGDVPQLLGALGHVLGALWQGLRWPWLAVSGLAVAAAALLWVWLWRRSAPRSGSL